MGCTTLFDVLRARTEDLSPMLHGRAAWKDIWLNVIPRGEYPQGAGYVRSTFEIARSEPGSEEESWQTIQKIADNSSGACALTYNQRYVGELEKTYSPEMFGLMGPLVCQDDFTMYYKSAEFWKKYMMRLEQNNKKSVSNRLGNVYRQYSYKASCNAGFSFAVGKWAVSQPPPQFVDMTDFTGVGGGILGLPTSELLQSHLDATAIQLMEEGADEGDYDGWITQGPDGPIWPLYIGSEASKNLFLNNSELRSDLNQGFQGWGDVNPTLRRMGASGVLKNFRHVINRFPARWIYVPYGAKVNYTATGPTSNAGTTVPYDNTAGVIPGVGNPANTPTPVASNPILLRIPSFVNSTNSTDVTKGQAGVVNGVWRDPNVTQLAGSTTNVAVYESCEVIHPEVMKEEVLLPVNTMPGMDLNAQNYFGEWKFVTGNDALLGIGNCTGITDPLHKQGRHFAEYRHALMPNLPVFGRMLLFKRCSSAFDELRCS